MAGSTEDEMTHSRWQNIWQAEEKPRFDIGYPAPALTKAIADGLIPEGRALVPGCGRGYDVTALATATRYAVGIDIVPIAIEEANKRLSSLSEDDHPGFVKANAEFKVASFFDLSEQFDFVYDYTFLCALDPSIRNNWASKMAELVKTGGLLMTLIFPIREDENIPGPPFTVSLRLLENLLEPLGFEKEKLEVLPPELSHPGREGSPPMNAKSGIGLWRKK